MLHHINHVGPFDTSKKGNKYIPVIVDGFTKFVIFKPVKNMTTKSVNRVDVPVWGTCSFNNGQRNSLYITNFPIIL